MAKKEKHIAALESDSGGFTPRGFGITGSDEATAKFMSFKKYFAPYGILEFRPSGGGADIGPLRTQGVPVLGFIPDSQRYFDYHHSSIDTFDKVNRRELELGSAAMAALIYLIDKEGLE